MRLMKMSMNLHFKIGYIWYVKLVQIVHGDHGDFKPKFTHFLTRKHSEVVISLVTEIL